MRKLAAALCLLLTSCVCRGEQAHTWACLAQKRIVDCTTAEIQPAIQALFPLVAHLLDGAGGDPKWEEYLISLEAIGLDIIACTAQTVVDNESMVAAKMPDPGEAPETALSHLRTRFTARSTEARARFEMWRTRRLPAATVIKLR